MTINQSLDATAERLPLGRDDPILQELWQVKAKINLEANYDVAVLAAQARALDVDGLLRRLGGDAARPHYSAAAG